MAFLTPGMATLGGSGFSLKRGSSRYLRTASGYPVTLYATLTDKPKSLTIYGNDGGVGDKTANLFDDKKWVINTIVNDANGAIVNNQGNIWETAGTGTSYLSIANYYFAIPAGVTSLHISQDLKIWYGYRIGFYDVNKSFLSCVSHLTMSSGENNVTVPDGAAYFAISRRRDHGTAAYVMINVGSTALPCEPYGYKIPILVQGRNLFDKDAAVTGYINASTGNLAGINSSEYFATNYITIDSGETYCWNDGQSRANAGAWYNANKEFISGFSSPRGNVVITAPSGAAYVRLTGNLSAIDTMQLIEGSANLPYEPYINKTINLYSDAQLEARESVNLFDTEHIWDNTTPEVNWGRYCYLKLKPNTSYIISSNAPSTTTTSGGSTVPTALLFFLSGKVSSGASFAVNGVYDGQSQTATSDTEGCVTVVFREKAGAINLSKDDVTQNVYEIMLAEGTTVLPYEPYGTIYDTLTIADSTATLSPKATGGDDTDLTAMQDRTQDMTLPEAEQLIVSAGTAVEPESITIEYYSKLKGDN